MYFGSVIHQIKPFNFLLSEKLCSRSQYTYISRRLYWEEWNSYTIFEYVLENFCVHCIYLISMSLRWNKRDWLIDWLNIQITLFQITTGGTCCSPIYFRMYFEKDNALSLIFDTPRRNLTIYHYIGLQYERVFLDARPISKPSVPHSITYIDIFPLNLNGNCVHHLYLSLYHLGHFIRTFSRSPPFP